MKGSAILIIEDEEKGRIIRSLNDYLQVLTTVLLFASGGAVLFSIIGGYFITGLSLILRPIHQLIQTMETIRKSGTFQRLSVGKPSEEDELSRLGTTFNDMIQKLEERLKKN